MSKKFIDYWESYQMPFEDNVNEYLAHEDFILKGKFSFLKNAMKLSAKAKFNSDLGADGTSRVTGAADYTLTHAISPWSRYMISHRADKLTFDGNFELWRNEDVYVSLYSTLNITQTESVRDLPSKLHVRVHHKNDAIVSLGVEDYDITKSGAPDVLSALALYGGDVTNEVRAFGGIYSGFKLSTSTLLFHKYLLGIKHKDVTGYLELAAGDVEMKLIDKITKHVTFKKEWQNDMTLRLMGTPSSTFRVGGDLAYNFQSTALNTRLYAHYDIDKDTFFKARWTHKDETLTLSLNHNFRGLITFGVTGKFNCIKSHTGAKDVSTTGGQYGHIKSKFGIYTEINETLI